MAIDKDIILRIIRKYGITLSIFTALSTGLVTLVNNLTASIIEQKIVKQQMQLLNQIIPSNLYNNQLLKECYLVTDLALGNNAPHRLYLARKNNIPVAAAIETTVPDGYTGTIDLLVGADFSGKILGVRVTRHNETPGLGDKIELRLSDWITQFSGKLLCSDNEERWTIKKDGGMFDQFTGATITPRAVVNAIKRTDNYLKKNFDFLEKMPHCGEPIRE